MHDIWWRALFAIAKFIASVIMVFCVGYCVVAINFLKKNSRIGFNVGMLDA